MEHLLNLSHQVVMLWKVENYMKIQFTFIPQFTMFLCYNKFYEVVPADAKENLEQFEYKSKFMPKKISSQSSISKIKDDIIKDFIKEDRIIDDQMLYIKCFYKFKN